MAGNGSDDLLTIITRSFVGPGDTIAYPTPSYISVPNACRTAKRQLGGSPIHVGMDSEPRLFLGKPAQTGVPANPNSPSGTCLPPEAVADLAGSLDCPLVVDEAYADFAETNSVGLVKDHPNVHRHSHLEQGIEPRRAAHGLLDRSARRHRGSE